MTNFVRTPRTPTPTNLVRAPHAQAAQVVFNLKRQPPINFNVVLHKHALEHGLTLHNFGLHPHPTGVKLSVNVGGHLENAKHFANSAVSKFSTYIHNAEVRFGNATNLR